METIGLTPEQNNFRPRKTDLKTLRLPEYLIRSLEKEAYEEDTNLNSLCSSIITRHVEWGRRARRAGFMTMSKTTFLSVLEAADKDRLVSLAREKLPDSWRDLAEFRFGNDSLETMAQFFTFIARHGWSADLGFTIGDGEYRMLFEHE